MQKPAVSRDRPLPSGKISNSNALLVTVKSNQLLLANSNVLLR